jgi:tetratricopeptide (TPR) repeat protein
MSSNNSREWFESTMKWFKDTYGKHFEDISDIHDWKLLESAAIYRKHTGDLDGAIEAMTKAIGLTRNVPALAEKTCSMLNYLAAELFECKEEHDRAEEAIREALQLSADLPSSIHGDNLLILARLQFAKGQYREALASAVRAREVHQNRGHAHGVAQAAELLEKINANIQD